MTDRVGKVAAGQIVGARERQEDAFAALDLSDGRQERLLLVVADGMGGHRGAAEAAQTAVRRFCESLQNAQGPLAQRLRPALTGANDAIAMGALRDPALDGAGCTLLSAAIEDGALSWISVGDSPLYLFRDRKLRKLNEDHSMRPVFSELVSAGRLSAGAAARDPRRHSLRSALTGEEIPLVSHSPAPLLLLPGDAVVLASDGLETLSSRVISRILRRSAGVHPAVVVERLLAALEANRARQQDNATIVLCRILADEERRPRNRSAKTWRFGARRFLLAIVLGSALLLGAWYGFRVLAL